MPIAWKGIGPNGVMYYDAERTCPLAIEAHARSLSRAGYSVLLTPAGTLPSQFFTPPD